MAKKKEAKKPAMTQNKSASPTKSPAAQAKGEKKGVKASAKSAEKATATPPAPGEEQVDLEELEEQAEIAAASATNAAMAGAVPITETSVSFKNFRHHPDMENFYRFIYENDLRFEALAIIDEVLTEKRNRKKIKVEKSKSH